VDRRARIGTALIEPGKPWQNGVTESFNGKFRDECLSLEWFRSRTEAKILIEAWRRHYNGVRSHSSLGYLTPNEFAAQAARPAPCNATDRGAAVNGASAPRSVAEPSRRGQLQPAKPSQAKRGPKNQGRSPPVCYRRLALKYPAKPIGG
jgi:putative transposase